MPSIVNFLAPRITESEYFPRLSNGDMLPRVQKLSDSNVETGPVVNMLTDSSSDCDDCGSSNTSVRRVDSTTRRNSDTSQSTTDTESSTNTSTNTSTETNSGYGGGGGSAQFSASTGNGGQFNTM